MDMQLPNHVYNNLKRHSSVANKRTHKLHEKKEHSTAVSYKNFQTPTILLMLIVLLSQSLHVFLSFISLFSHNLVSTIKSRTTVSLTAEKSLINPVIGSLDIE